MGEGMGDRDKMQAGRREDPTKTLGLGKGLEEVRQKVQSLSEQETSGQWKGREAETQRRFSLQGLTPIGTIFSSGSGFWYHEVQGIKFMLSIHGTSC